MVTILSLKLVPIRSTCTLWVRKMIERVSVIVPAWTQPQIRFCILPRSSFGTSDTSSLILLKIISKTTIRTGSAHREALNYEGKSWAEKEERVRWFRRRRRRCCCWDSPGYMLLFSRSVRTMYPLLFRRIPFQFGEWWGSKADAREGKSARVLLKSCWNPAAWAPGRDKKTTAYTLSHTHTLP